MCKTFGSLNIVVRSSGGVMVKILACRARGPGFNSRSRCYNFSGWLSPASSRYMAEISVMIQCVSLSFVCL